MEEKARRAFAKQTRSQRRKETKYSAKNIYVAIKEVGRIKCLIVIVPKKVDLVYGSLYMFYLCKAAPAAVYMIVTRIKKSEI